MSPPAEHVDRRRVEADDPATARRPAAWRLGNLPLPEPYLLGIAAGAGLDRVRPWRLPGPAWAHQLAGWPLVVAGAHLVARSWAAAWQVDLAHPDRLVRAGPYAASRNPMYVGWALLHLGAGVVRGSGWIVAALPAAAAEVHRAVLREERALAAAFDADFGRYAAQVPRYLPRRPSRRDGRRGGTHRPKQMVRPDRTSSAL